MKLNEFPQIASNFEMISGIIQSASERIGRSNKDIKLIAVSKKQPLEKILFAQQLGINNFGENYPEETLKKIDCLQSDADSLSWHMIGHLQSRKAKIVALHFSCIHSIDSVHVAAVLNDELEKNNRTINGLIELNLSGEDTKTGFPAWSPELLDQTINDIQSIILFHRIRMIGLMTMPPLSENAEESRPMYKKLREIMIHISKIYPTQNWIELSMGTSFDYEVAIEEGATMIRIGQGLFGQR